MLVAALALVLFWRIHDEEALMHQQFGAEWEGYARRSSRLVPFLF
jgi:protein-S-isoprenylcysteine O-methyltransferase Ste14